MSQKNSWDIIKQEMTRRSRPGSVGYAEDLDNAGQVFVALRKHLSDYETAKAAYNADDEVSQALALVTNPHYKAMRAGLYGDENIMETQGE